VGAAGNLSVRLGRQVLITPSGVPPDRLRPEAIVAATDPQASSEVAVHLAVYAARQDVRAVVHAHPVHASVLAVIREPLPALLDEVRPVLGGEGAGCRLRATGHSGAGGQRGRRAG